MLLALPSLCAVCNGWGSQRVCDPCRHRYTPPALRCATCALRVEPGVLRCGACTLEPPPFSAAVAAVDYAFPWNSFVTRLKFHAALDLAPTMAGLLADAARRSGRPLPDGLLPVPLGRDRLAQRGLNQAWELARRVSRHLGVAAHADLLHRLVDTPRLADLPREGRAQAIRGAFGLAPGASRHVQGRSFALVDDVMTTGATAAEAARTLRATGAASVELWVFARTPAP